jgi:poly-gamma-glutamate capsule biosynthesis protein CapA/YwtB (metallophosphatase superfamily)
MPSPETRRLALVLGGALLAAAAIAGALGAALPSRAAPRPAASSVATAVTVGTPSAARAPAASAPGPAAAGSQALPVAAPAVDKATPLVIMAGGDVNFGRECGQAILADVRYDPFRHVEPLWRDADLRFVNLESQLSDQKGETQSPRNRLIFTGPPNGGLTLAQARIQIASTANNHAWDYGRGALFETLDNLARAGVKSVGTGRTLDEAFAPAVLEARGRRIAVFAVTQIWNAGDFETHEGKKYVAWARLNRLKKALARAKKEFDVVLLSYHGGAEYIDAPVGPTRRFLEPIAKAGLVDAVLGHHPHVPQGIGWYGGTPVFYSLGNFVFAGHDWAPWTKTGYVARLEIDPGRSLVARVCPVALDGHVPKPIAQSDPAGLRVRQHIIDTSTSVGGSTVGEADAHGCFEVLPPGERPPGTNQSGPRPLAEP